MSSELIERIRKIVSQGGISKSGLARAAGLHPNSLRDVALPGWNPTADTLAKLEHVLDENDDSPGIVPMVFTFAFFRWDAQRSDIMKQRKRWAGILAGWRRALPSVLHV